MTQSRIFAANCCRLWNQLTVQKSNARSSTHEMKLKTNALLKRVHTKYTTTAAICKHNQFVNRCWLALDHEKYVFFTIHERKTFSNNRVMHTTQQSDCCQYKRQKTHHRCLWRWCVGNSINEKVFIYLKDWVALRAPSAKKQSKTPC